MAEKTESDGKLSSSAPKITPNLYGHKSGNFTTKVPQQTTKKSFVKVDTFWFNAF